MNCYVIENIFFSGKIHQNEGMYDVPFNYVELCGCFYPFAFSTVM